MMRMMMRMRMRSWWWRREDHTLYLSSPSLDSGISSSQGLNLVFLMFIRGRDCNHANPGDNSPPRVPTSAIDGAGDRCDAIACTWEGEDGGMLETSLSVGRRSRLVLLDPPSARSASRSAGEGAKARMVIDEKSESMSGGDVLKTPFGTVRCMEGGGGGGGGGGGAEGGANGSNGPGPA